MLKYLYSILYGYFTQKCIFVNDVKYIKKKYTNNNNSSLSHTLRQSKRYNAEGLTECQIGQGWASEGKRFDYLIRIVMVANETGGHFAPSNGW